MSPQRQRQRRWRQRGGGVYGALHHMTHWREAATRSNSTGSRKHGGPTAGGRIGSDRSAVMTRQRARRRYAGKLISQQLKLPAARRQPAGWQQKRKRASGSWRQLLPGPRAPALRKAIIPAARSWTQWRPQPAAISEWAVELKGLVPQQNAC
jgi:hypothetical protein